MQGSFELTYWEEDGSGREPGNDFGRWCISQLLETSALQTISECAKLVVGRSGQEGDGFDIRCREGDE